MSTGTGSYTALCTGAALLSGLFFLTAPLPSKTAFAQAMSAAPGSAIARCAAIDDNSRRLACYDALAEDVMAAQKTIAGNNPDRQNTRDTSDGKANAQATQGDKFGLPPTPATAPEDTERHTSIVNVRRKPRGAWIFTMENGQTWEQTDTARISPPSAGDTVKITKSAMGGFFATINGRSIRVKRVR